jgi:double-stranded uracil-DNA glycosylase
VPAHRRPTRAEITVAEGKTLPDIIAPNLKVLLSGIKPGLYTTAIGHHLRRSGNRFWPVLYASGFTDRLLSPYEEHELLPRGYGITNLVARAGSRADDLNEESPLLFVDKFEHGYGG